MKNTLLNFSAEATAPSDPELVIFLNFSAEVTASSYQDLDLAGIEKRNGYLTFVRSIVGGPVLSELLQAYAAIKEKDTKQRERQLRRTIFGHQKLGPVARNIIKLWYMGGVWDPLPQAWTDAYGARANNVVAVASPTSYIDALIYKVIGANPPGARPPGFESWTEPPNIPFF